MSFESAQRLYDMQSDDQCCDGEETLYEGEEEISPREIDDIFKLWEEVIKR